MSTPIKQLGGSIKGKCQVHGRTCTAKEEGIVKAVRDLNSGNQINTCDPCLKDNLKKGAWQDQGELDAKAQCALQSKEMIENLSQNFLSARESRDQELLKTATDNLREAMLEAGVTSHPTVWKGKPVIIHRRPKYCGIQLGKTDEANKWLAENGLPAGIHEAVQEHLNEGNRLPTHLFKVLWDLEAFPKWTGKTKAQ